MVTLIVCIKRKAGMSREDFSRYWRDNHGPLVASCASFTRYIAGYSQYHLTGEDGEAAEFGVAGVYDGIARLEFRSAEDMEAAFADPDYLANVRPDEPRFIDIDGCMSFVTEENRVI
jgi:uncharacterized protein (TIGR02118 family)